MADILDAAQVQKQIDDAAKQIDPQLVTDTATPSQPTPPAPDSSPVGATTPPEPPPAPAVEPVVTTVTTTTPSASPSVPAQTTTSTTAFVAPVAPTPPPAPAPAPSETPNPTSAAPSDFVVAPASPPPPTTPPKSGKKRSGGKGILVAILLLLATALPASVYFISQQKQQVTELRSSASLCCEGGKCNDGWEFGRDETTPHASCADRARQACESHGGLQSGAGQCAGTGGGGTSDGGSTGGGATGCGGYSSGGTGQCSSADANKCREYSECCALGKSRIIKATCLADGREQFTVVSSCNDALPAGVCGVAPTSGPVEPTCTAGKFFWPSNQGGDDQCHDISGTQAPGGGSGTCTNASGCSIPSGGCLRGYKCSPTEITAQGFCLVNPFSPQANTNYQAEADSTCKYIQVDSFSAAKCSAGVTTTTAHDGTIIYRPNLNGPGCKGTTPTSPPQSPTSPPPPLTCETIRIYDSAGTNITQAVRSGTRKLAIGETVTIATPKGSATKAHFRIQGVTTFADNNSTLTTATEYRLNITIPSTITQATGQFEAEIFVNGQWK